jgi:hypothetical protein
MWKHNKYEKGKTIPPKVSKFRVTASNDIEVEKFPQIQKDC